MSVEVVIPVLKVSDMAKALAFYTEVLGFTEPWSWGEPAQYGGVQAAAGKDAAIHLSVEPEGHPKGEAYILVNDVDALYERVTGAELVHELADQPYGMRDFMVRDPFGNCLSFGQDSA
jgi:uncharacterized glyoxalase superfamily protein PhnB